MSNPIDGRMIHWIAQHPDRADVLAMLALCGGSATIFQLRVRCAEVAEVEATIAAMTVRHVVVDGDRVVLTPAGAAWAQILFRTSVAWLQLRQGLARLSEEDVDAP